MAQPTMQGLVDESGKNVDINHEELRELLNSGVPYDRNISKYKNIKRYLKIATKQKC